MKTLAILTLLALTAAPAWMPARAQPIRDVPGTEPAPVPTVPALPPDTTRAPPEMERAREAQGNTLGSGPTRDRSGGGTDAGPVASTPYSGVPERGDAAGGASSLGR